MATIDVATADGLHVLDQDGRPAGRELEGRPVTAIVRDADERWAIVDRSELWRGPGGAWEPVAELEGHEATCLAMTDALHVGSSEARLFRLEDRSLVPVAAFDVA